MEGISPEATPMTNGGSLAESCEFLMCRQREPEGRARPEFQTPALDDHMLSTRLI
jgi:hypothetical protein